MSSIEVSSNLYLVRKLSKEAMVNAAISIGHLTTGYAQDLCPVDTGRLRASITHAYSDDDDNKVILLVGTNVEYAPYVELGHHTSSGSMVAARPFLRPAAEGHGAEYEEILKRIMSM